MRFDIRLPSLLLTLAICGSASAQEIDTRAEALRRQREEKARATTPYEPSGLETGMKFGEDRAIMLIGREGFYPKIGSLTTGSGFALGAGFRDRSVFRYHGILDTWTARTFQDYWAIETRATFPDLANGRVLAEAWASFRDYPQEDFFGIGPEAQRSDHVTFALETTTFAARGSVRAVGPLRLGGAFEYIQPTVGQGTNSDVPSIEERFSEATAPGLLRQPDFLHTLVFLEVDSRQPRNARRGGLYRVEFGRYADRDLDAYSFERVAVDLRQYVSFLAERRVLAARVSTWTSEEDPGHAVPFYLMPYLGGNDTMRGFREYRFRGPHAVLLQGEYRYEIWSGFEGAFFYDAGKVAARRADLNFRNLEGDYGFGFRFNTDNGVVMRVDAGFGSSDGKHLYITFGGVF
jgi:hypothetical protein